jgi:uncharacterized tellurite resistance protein B-like protein
MTDMKDEQLILTLAKVLIAAAWVDGDLDHDEINSMKDLLYRLPQISARQWASLAIYIETPVGDEERERLVAELQNAIRSGKDKELALDTLEEILEADGEVTDTERAVVESIKASIESVDIGLLGGFMKAVTGRRVQAVANAPNREAYLDDFIKNKVYYGVRRRLDLGEAELDLPEDQLRRLGLAGGMMAQVAHVNPQISDGEVTAMVDALQDHWHLDAEQAAFVAGVAVSETASLLDPYRLAREFATDCSYEERAEFLDVLFAVAVADGKASYDEIEEIRQIARSLKLAPSDFIDAKLKIPGDQREQ